MKLQDVIKAGLAVGGIVATTITFSYSTFASKEYVKEAIVDRLDRIESKLDRLIESRQDQRAPCPVGEKER